MKVSQTAVFTFHCQNIRLEISDMTRLVEPARSYEVIYSHIAHKDLTKENIAALKK